MSTVRAVAKSRIGWRLLVSIPVFLGVPAVTLLLMNVVGGDVVPGLTISPTLHPGDIERLREAAGLNQPIPVQYWNWIVGVMTGDFGRSMVDGTPVLTHIKARLPHTALLMLCSLLLGLLVAVPLGVASARRRGKMVDHALTAVSVFGYSIPQFWFGLVLILIFAVQFNRWGLPSLPVGGAYTPLDGGIADRIRHLILPTIVLGSVYIAIWSRFVRASVIEVLSQDYVRTARAKGAKERRVVYVHALRNALAPLVTLVALELPGFVSGALVVEAVFGWPGLGQLVYNRSLQFDFTLVVGVTTFIALAVVFANLAADLLYRRLDPKVHL